MRPRFQGDLSDVHSFRRLGRPIAAGAVLCVRAWIYRTPELRSSMHLITRDPELCVLTSLALSELLDSPLGSDHAVVVPLRPGRKHVFPSARWGEVSVDDITLGWSVTDAP